MGKTVSLLLFVKLSKLLFYRENKIFEASGVSHAILRQVLDVAENTTQGQ